MIKSGLYEKMDKLDSIKSRAKLGTILIGSGIIIFFPSMAIFHSNAACLFALCLAGLGVYFYLGLTKKYKKLYKELFVEDTLKKNFDNVFYAWKAGFSPDVIKGFRLFGFATSYKTEDYLKASYKGINFEMSDAIIMDNTSKNNKSVFRGRIIVFDFPDKRIAPTRIYTRFFIKRNIEAIRQAEKVELEDVRFNEEFDVFSQSPHDTFYLLTPHFMERLLVLKERYKSIAMCFEYNKVVFAFNEAVNNAFDGVITNDITYPEEVAKVQKDIDDIKYIIETIDQIGG